MRIAIDAMGGDHAPAEIVRGTLDAATAHPEAEFVLVGQPQALERELSRAATPTNVRQVAADDVIAMDDEPSRAVRRKPGSSLCVACKLVAQGEAEAIFSAGNTGAAAAAASLLIGRIDGILRPAIAAIVPTAAGKAVVCDVGANVDCRPEWLVQFGIMASLYATDVEGIANPRVALLSIGEEPCKGNALVKSCHPLMDAAGLNWVGNLDGKDVFRGAADVITCDGFSGNLLLKIAEGASELFVGMVKDALTSSPRAKLGGLLVKPGLRGLKQKLDYAEYGGAFLLGTKGLVVIAHGRSDRRAVASGLRRAVEGIAHGLVESMIERFQPGGTATAA